MLTDNDNFVQMDINEKIKDFNYENNILDLMKEKQKLKEVKNRLKNETFRVKNKKIKKRFLLVKNNRIAKLYFN